MKQPDAFRKMIIPMLGTSDLIGKNGKYLSSEVAKLLRAQHKKVVRMVKAQPANLYEVSRATNDWISKSDLLAALDRRATGGAA